MAVSFLSKSEMQVILPTADCFLRMCVYILETKAKLYLLSQESL